MQIAIHQSHQIAAKTSASRDTAGFLLVLVALILLPVERFAFFTSLRLVDFVLLPLVAYALLRAWFANQRFYLPLVLPAGLILIASLTATMFGMAYMRGIIAFFQEIYLLFWFIVLTNLLIQLAKSGVNSLLKAWAVIAACEAIATAMGMLHIGPYIFYTEPIAGYVITLAGVNRGIGTFVNPNATAAYLSISFFVVLAVRWPVWLKGLLGLCILAGLYATGSMGAMLSTAGGFLVMLFVFACMYNMQAARHWIGLMLILGSLLLLIGFILGPMIIESLPGVTHARWLLLSLGRLPTSLSSRLLLVQNCWQIYQHHLLGTGPNTCDLHNDYLAFLFERGPLGLAGWLWLIGASLRLCWRTARAQEKLFQRWQILALGAGFLAIMLNAFSHEVSHFRQVWMLMAFLFASCALLSRLPSKQIFLDGTTES